MEDTSIMKKLYSLILVTLVSLMVMSCGSKTNNSINPAVRLSTKDITAFSIIDPTSGKTISTVSKIDTDALNILVYVPYGMELASLTPSITQTGVSIKPNDHTVQDFTSEVPYVVTAADGSTKTYIVTVKQASSKDISSFVIGIPGTTLTVSGIIGTNTIVLTVPFSTEVSALQPIISIPSGSTINPVSLDEINFSSPVTYTVTATDGTQKTYTVTINIALSSSKDITAFSVLDKTGTINESALPNPTIAVTVPFGTSAGDLSSAIAQFSTNGHSVAVGSTPQFSGVTANNFNRTAQ